MSCRDRSRSSAILTLQPPLQGLPPRVPRLPSHLYWLQPCLTLCEIGLAARFSDGGSAPRQLTIASRGVHVLLLERPRRVRDLGQHRGAEAGLQQQFLV